MAPHRHQDSRGFAWPSFVAHREASRRMATHRTVRIHTASLRDAARCGALHPFAWPRYALRGIASMT